jgi:hypothetical protein
MLQFVTVFAELPVAAMPNVPVVQRLSSWSSVCSEHRSSIPHFSCELDCRIHDRYVPLWGVILVPLKLLLPRVDASASVEFSFQVGSGCVMRDHHTVNVQQIPPKARRALPKSVQFPKV